MTARAAAAWLGAIAALLATAGHAGARAVVVVEGLVDDQHGNRLANITFLAANGDALSFGESVVGIRTLAVSANTAATGGLNSAGTSPAFEVGDTLLSWATI